MNSLPYVLQVIVHEEVDCNIEGLHDSLDFQDNIYLQYVDQINDEDMN